MKETLTDSHLSWELIQKRCRGSIPLDAIPNIISIAFEEFRCLERIGVLTCPW